ncbi:hypothetical protein Ancab_012989 [Ancistrocladus abbreviatus]
MAFSFSCCASLYPQFQAKANPTNSMDLKKVRNLVESVGVPSVVAPPQQSLQKGHWVKLICGASFEDVVDIRNLSLVYTLAGVDCIDCAADASVVSAVNEGIEAAIDILPLRRPWVMISVNDDEDLHFRKAEFNPEDCPIDCSRPCEVVCPAQAISLEERELTEVLSSCTSMPRVLKGGVVTERCYGCGRCLPVCPYDKIRVTTYLRDASTTAELLKRDDVDAVEIHTSGRQIASFEDLWSGLGDSINYLKLVAISLPNVGKSATTLMNTIFSIMRPDLRCYNLWQLDGRPMSGDIGRGATREAIAFAVRVANAKDRPPGFLQLAGGTNAHTVHGLKKEGHFRTTSTARILRAGILTGKVPTPWNSLISGIAYGGYARKIVGRILSKMQVQHGLACIEDHPEYLREALIEALGLVGTVKCYDPSSISQK